MHAYHTYQDFKNLVKHVSVAALNTVAPVWEGSISEYSRHTLFIYWQGRLCCQLTGSTLGFLIEAIKGGFVSRRLRWLLASFAAWSASMIGMFFDCKLTDSCLCCSKDQVSKLEPKVSVKVFLHCQQASCLPQVIITCHHHMSHSQSERCPAGPHNFAEQPLRPHGELSGGMNREASHFHPRDWRAAVSCGTAAWVLETAEWVCQAPCRGPGHLFSAGTA